MAIALFGGRIGRASRRHPAGHCLHRRARRACRDTRSHGVTVSTLDPESSDRGSNPRETFDRAIDSERPSGGTPLEHVDVAPRALVKDACAAAAGEGASLAGVRDGVNSVAPDRSR